MRSYIMRQFRFLAMLTAGYAATLAVALLIHL